jgi:hypothetical protein
MNNRNLGKCLVKEAGHSTDFSERERFNLAFYSLQSQTQIQSLASGERSQILLLNFLQIRFQPQVRNPSGIDCNKTVSNKQPRETLVNQSDTPLGSSQKTHFNRAFYFIADPGSTAVPEPWPRIDYTFPGGTCSPEEWLEAVTLGSRRGVWNGTFYVYAPCEADFRIHTASQACEILSTFDSVLIIGDSFERQLTGGFFILLRDNFVNGALKQWEFEDNADIKVNTLFALSCSRSLSEDFRMVQKCLEMMFVREPLHSAAGTLCDPALKQWEFANKPDINLGNRFFSCFLYEIATCCSKFSSKSLGFLHRA